MDMSSLLIATLLVCGDQPGDSLAEQTKAAAPNAAAARDFPVTGQSKPELAEFDRWAREFMTTNQIPGGAVAVVKAGWLVYARGFGYADREAKAPVEPTALFRIASVSKPITAVAVLQLVERGKLKLSDKVVDLLDIKPHFEAGAKFDPRWNNVTVEHCLTHTGGWDRDKSFDPMFQAVRMSKSMKIELPVEPVHVIRYMLGQPLDFDPGQRYAYSNFGYCLLGRVIEEISGEPYETYVQRNVFKPLGIRGPRIGRSLADQRVEGEVKYYDVGGATDTAVVGPGAGKDKVPIGYGAWCQETLDSHGGWIASVVDLVRFGSALDVPDERSPQTQRLLKAETLKAMFSPHAVIRPAGENGNGRLDYGYGWLVSSDGDGRTITQHGGSLPCTAAMLMRLPDGITVAVLFNLGQTPDRKFLGRQLEAPLVKLAQSVKVWPEDDLFR
jgi:N-acyl-D-amino-acid deacylase